MKSRELQEIASLAAAAGGERGEFFRLAFALLRRSFEGKQPSLLLYHPARETFFRRIAAEDGGAVAIRPISLSLEEFPRAFADGMAGGSTFRGQGPYPVGLPEFAGTFLCHPVRSGDSTIAVLVTGDRATRGETAAPFVIPLVECCAVAQWHEEAGALLPRAAERVETDQLAALRDKYLEAYRQLEKSEERAEALRKERETLAKQVERASMELQAMGSELSLLRLDMIESGGVRNVVELLDGELLDALPGLAEGYFAEAVAAAGCEGGILLEMRGTDPTPVFRCGEWRYSSGDAEERDLWLVASLMPLLASRGEEVGIIRHGQEMEVASRESRPDLLLVPAFGEGGRLAGAALVTGAGLPWPPQQRSGELRERLKEVLALRAAEGGSGGGRRELKAGVVRGILGPLAGSRRGLAATLPGALLAEVNFLVPEGSDKSPGRMAAAIDHIARDCGLVPLHPLFGRFLAVHPASPPPVGGVIAAMEEIRRLIGQQRPRILLGYFPLTVMRGVGSEAVPWLHSPFLSWARAVLPKVPDGAIALAPVLGRNAGVNLKLEEREGFFLTG